MSICTNHCTNHKKVRKIVPTTVPSTFNKWQNSTEKSQAHNLKVVGSNPTPATKSNKTPPTYSVGGVCSSSILRPYPANLGPELRQARFNFLGDSYIAPHDCRTLSMRDPSMFGRLDLGARWRGGRGPRAATWIIGGWDRPSSMAGEILVSPARLSDRG